MDFLLDPASAVPIYAQVVEQIRRQVATGVLQAGDRLPSVRDLAISLRINRNTAARVYQVLEREHVLETRTGQGTFITAGGTRWSREECRRRVAASLDQVLVEAHHLDVSRDELQALLRERIAAFDKDREARPGRSRKGENG